MPYYLPPDYIDNSNVKLLDVLKKTIGEMEQRQAAFASGYFNPKVWQMLGEELTRLTSLRLLLGRQPEVEQGGLETLDLRRYYRAKVADDVQSLTYNLTHLRLMEGLIAFLQRDAVQVRIYPDKTFLHAKAYIFPQLAIVGSSNFTPSGLTHNSELNLVRKEEAVARALLNEWFNVKWELSQDYKPDLIATLEASKFGSKPYSPFEVFIKALYDYFKDRISVEQANIAIDLAVFQEEGRQEAIRLLEQWGSVLIADAVGLGKTYLGMALLEHFVVTKRRRGHIPRALVICPAQLRESVWRKKLEEFAIPITGVLSQEEIGREDFPWQQYRSIDVLVIDESHNFRNPGTNRYRNLQKLILGGKRDKKVILLTATPINNSIWDLYHQLLLMARSSDAYYRDAGITNLKGFMTRVDKGEAELFDLLEQTTVRRSRTDIKRRQQAGEKVIIAGKAIQFPDRVLQRIDYDLEGTYQGVYREIATQIEQLVLVSYNIEQFVRGARGQEKETQLVVQRNNAVIAIMKTLYLKRLESSVAAFEVSIRRQARFQERFVELLKQGKLLDAARYRKLLSLEGEDDEQERVGPGSPAGSGTRPRAADQEVEQILKELPSVQAGDYDLPAITRQVEADLAVLQEILQWLDIVRSRSSSAPASDDKVQQVKARLSGALKGRKVLLFTSFQDTARYIYEQLCDDQDWLHAAGKPRIELITGATKGPDRTRLIQRFAPLANRPGGEDSTTLAALTWQPPDGELDILISTDVLSEGQNLQDAGVVLNYDLHWNPVRMIQRAGRVDRIGSTQNPITIVNCFPQQGLELLLNLVKSLTDKIAAIDRNVGLDASVLGELVSDKSLEELKRIRANDRQVVDELEQQAELVSTEEMKFPLVRYIQDLGAEIVQDIPQGIHSIRQMSAGKARGIFFAFKARERQFWRFYPADGSAPLKQVRQVFRLIECSKTEPRATQTESIFPHLERATADIMTELRSERSSRKIRLALKGTALKLYNAINVPTLFGQLEEETRIRFTETLQQVSLKPFERDPHLKGLLRRYEESKDSAAFASALDEFFLENGLYQDYAAPQLSEEIKAEHLELVCYEWLV